MKTFVTLMKREFWENRGGFYWAPLAVAAFCLIVLTIGVLIAHGWFGEFKGKLHIGAGVDIGTFMRAVPDSALEGLARGWDIALLGMGTILQVILTFVVFFYCVASLYDERRDRSVLFWKSLPVSDGMTVLSKVLAAALMAPILAWGATVVFHIAFMLLASLVTLVHGGSPMRLVFGPAEPLKIWALLLAKVPLNAVWMLPFYGWVMLASSFARSKAFLWAIVPPFMFGLAWTLLSMSRSFELPSSWVWTHVVARVMPFFVLDDDSPANATVAMLGMRMSRKGPALEWSDLGNVFANPELWVGAVIGLAMLAGAVWFRRTRELAD